MSTLFSFRGNLICSVLSLVSTVYPNKYAHGFCFAVLCCGYTLTDFPISIRLTSLALWQSNDCPSASKATLMNMDKYFMWIHYERLHNHNKAKHNKTVCIFLGIYCITMIYLSRVFVFVGLPVYVLRAERVGVCLVTPTIYTILVWYSIYSFELIILINDNGSLEHTFHDLAAAILWT